jgi:hypothetical protein
LHPVGDGYRHARIAHGIDDAAQLSSNPSSNGADWQSIDLPHDWAVELPFKNDPALMSKGYYPLGRSYPETSVGWYRRVLELPLRMPASESPSNSMAPTAKQCWSSTAFTSACTAADTMH